MHNNGHFILKITQLERIRFCDGAAMVSGDAPHQLQSLNSGDTCSFLKVTQRFEGDASQSRKSRTPLHGECEGSSTKRFHTPQNELPWR